MTLGNAIKLIRTARGMTQKDVARKLKVSANYISLVEGGRREPSLPFLRNLAALYNVPIAMFFMWQGKPVPGADAKSVNRLREVLMELDRIIVQADT
jgi:transcriptional regulator with XRE-family HTH domain